MESNLCVKDEFKMAKKIIDSGKYGQIEYSDEDIIILASPILGFPHLTDFVLIISQESQPFYVFQSVDDGDISFIVLETKDFFPNYKPVFNKRDMKILQVQRDEDMKVFGIVVVPKNPQSSTVNLKAPLVINLEKKLAKQIILEEDEWDIKTPLF